MKRIRWIAALSALALMLTIALRFIPTLLEEAERIMKAQMARGADFTSGGLIQRARSLLPLLVPTAQFENAVKWRTSLFHLAAVVGPAAGGLIIARSVPAAYLFSAGTTLLYTVLLWTLRLPEAPRSRRGSDRPCRWGRA